MRRALVPVVLAFACTPSPGERCNTDADCGAALCIYGFCRADVARAPADAGVCGSGLHDGGDGSCVPVGECAPGFARFFVDGDGDGVGAGAQLDDCAPLPPAAGRSLVGSDCDDANGDASAPTDAFVDGDGDGFTSGPAVACAGDALPAGFVATERLAPVLLFNAADVTTDVDFFFFGDWNDIDNAARCCGGTARANFDDEQSTGSLRLSSFVCSAEPQRIDRVRVHVRGRLEDDDEELGDLRLSVLLDRDGVPGVARELVAAWSAADADYVVEGTLEEWGVALEPADACDGSLGATIAVDGNGALNFDNRVEVDFVVVEVDGRADCDDDDGARFAPLVTFVDADADTFEGPDVGATCQGPVALLQPDAVVADDCDDGDERAFPGQTQGFTSERASGGFDYNCDGAVTKLNVTDVETCALDPATGACNQTTRTLSGDCGDVVEDDFCDASCAVADDTSPVRCR